MTATFSTIYHQTSLEHLSLAPTQPISKFTFARINIVDAPYRTFFRLLLLFFSFSLK